MFLAVFADWTLDFSIFAFSDDKSMEGNLDVLKNDF